MEIPVSPYMSTDVRRYSSRSPTSTHREDTVPHIPARHLQPGMLVAFRGLITGIVESVTIEGELARIVVVIRWLADDTIEVPA